MSLRPASSVSIRIATLVLLCAGGPATANALTDAHAGTPHVIRLDLVGTINPGSADYIHGGLHRAAEQHAAALLIVLDTPGGLLESTKDIVKDLLSARVPVIVYIAPSGAGAISAGLFVTLAAHIAAMAPGTNIGAAHPVGGQGESLSGDMAQKVESFAVSLVRTIAEQRERNVAWAEKAVLDSVSITEQEALDLNVINVVAPNVDALLHAIDGRTVQVDGQPVVLHTAGVRVDTQAMNAGQWIVNLLANPNLAYLLFMVGVVGLYVELTHPGVVVPGVVGGVALLLAFAALQVLPINYTGLALIGFGVMLLVAELFIPSFGVVGLGGLTSLMLGSLLLFDTPEPLLVVDRATIVAVAGILGVLMVVVGAVVARTRGRRPVTGSEGMVGQIGEVRRPADPSGRVKVFVHGEYWDAIPEEQVDVGAAVEVTAVHGLQIRVRRHERSVEPGKGA